MENTSVKSERNLSVKYKNTLSYKSVSEISEFEEPYEEETSEYLNRKEKDNSKINNVNNINQKLNESIHSVVSNFSKDIYEENENENVDDDKNI